MNELMNSFQKLIDTLSNAFSILDFSYIVSGGLAFLLILFDLHKNYTSFMMENLTITIVCGVFLSYICGLFAWLIGRFIRRKTFKIMYKQTIEETFRSVYNDAIASLTKIDDPKKMPMTYAPSLSYEYMWIGLEKKEEAASRVNYIHRFWVMQAVFEGLITVLILAIGILWHLKPDNADCELLCCMVLLSILFIFLMKLCCNEAKRCAETQIREVVLSYYQYVVK